MGRRYPENVDAAIEAAVRRDESVSEILKAMERGLLPGLDRPWPIPRRTLSYKVARFKERMATEQAKRDGSKRDLARELREAEEQREIERQEMERKVERVVAISGQEGMTPELAKTILRLDSHRELAELLDDVACKMRAKIERKAPPELLRVVELWHALPIDAMNAERGTEPRNRAGY